MNVGKGFACDGDVWILDLKKVDLIPTMMVSSDTDLCLHDLRDVRKTFHSHAHLVPTLVRSSSMDPLLVLLLVLVTHWKPPHQ